MIHVITSAEKCLEDFTPEVKTRLSEHQPNEEGNATTWCGDDPTFPLCGLIFLCNRPEQCQKKKKKASKNKQLEYFRCRQSSLLCSKTTKSGNLETFSPDSIQKYDVFTQTAAEQEAATRSHAGLSVTFRRSDSMYPTFPMMQQDRAFWNDLDDITVTWREVTSSKHHATVYTGTTGALTLKGKVGGMSL